MSVVCELDVAVRKCNCKCIACGADGGHCCRDWLECFVIDDPMSLVGHTRKASDKLLAAQGS